MCFGQRLVKLRKEKGLSQEALAEQVGTTRQAISKWENDQGYPETEKLLLLSNIFAVSTEYLLKGSDTVQTSSEGYYVSQEMARGYLAYSRKINCLLSAGFMFWALSGMPYVLLAQETVWQVLGMGVCVVLGIGAFAMAVFSDNDVYHVIEQEPLLFDPHFLRELSQEYLTVKRRCQVLGTPCTILFTAGLLAISLSAREHVTWSEAHALLFLALAVGIGGFVLTLGTLERYEVLVKNEAYCGRLWFKLKRKWREITAKL